LIQPTTAALCCAVVITISSARGFGGDQGGGTSTVERDALARRLFTEGLAQADAGHWAEAADSFNRAYTIRPSAQIAYNLATALARRGQLVRASELLTSIAGDSGARPAVRDAARDRLGQVLPRVARLAVQVTPVDRRHLWLDGRPLDVTASATAVTVDPGEHVVEVRRDSGVSLTRRLSLAEGDFQTVVIDAPPPLPSDPGTASVAVATSRAPAPQRSIFRSGWFWGVVGTAVVASAAVVLAPRGGGPESHGNVGTWDLPR
jgi:hypothetical protein